MSSLGITAVMPRAEAVVAAVESQRGQWAAVQTQREADRMRLSGLEQPSPVLGASERMARALFSRCSVLLSQRTGHRELQACA